MIKKLQKKIYFLNKSSLFLKNNNDDNIFYTTLDEDIEKYFFENTSNYINIDKFSTTKEINFSFNENLEVLQLAKKIDFIIHENNNIFFGNYFKLLSGIRILKNDIKKLHNFLKNTTKTKIIYFINKNNKINNDDKIFLILKEFKKKFKNIVFIKINSKIRNDTFYPLPIYEDINPTIKQKLLFFIKKQQQSLFVNKNKKNILFYLTEKKDQNILRKKISNCNFYNYEYFLNHKKENIQISKQKLKKINLLLKKKKYLPSSVYCKHFEKIYSELYKFHEFNKKNIGKIIKEKQIDCFITSHTTLISNTIKMMCVLEKIPTLTLIHGGNIGHFTNVMPYPHFTSSNTLIKNDYKFFQVNTNIMKNLIEKKNPYMNQKKFKNQLIVFEPTKYKKIKFLDKTNSATQLINIGYISRSELNVTKASYIKFQSNWNFFNIRKKILNKIISDEKVNINISTYNTEQKDSFTSSKLIKNLKKKNRIHFGVLNGKEVIEKSDIIIFEQFSTLLIEALFSKKPLIYISNPSLDIFKDQIKILKKQVFFVKNNNDLEKVINSIVFDKKKSFLFKKKIADKFLKNFYINKSSNNIVKFVLKMLSVKKNNEIKFI